MSGASIFPRALKPEWLLPDTGSGEKKTRGCAHDTTPSSQPWGLTSLPPSPIPRFEPETFFFSSALQLPQPPPSKSSHPTGVSLLLEAEDDGSWIRGFTPVYMGFLPTKKGRKKLPKTLLTSQHAEEGTPFFPFPYSFRHSNS